MSKYKVGEYMKNMEVILKALADETRLRILNLLFEQELCVCDIMAALQITQTKASRHLIYLKNAGLVKDRKQAQWVHYSLLDIDEFEFIKSLVFKNLRSNPVFQADLNQLKLWFQEKNTSCSGECKGPESDEV